MLAIDARQVDTEMAAEATKVRVTGDRITAIGKTLTTYDALDTGLFVCAGAVRGVTSRAAGGRHDPQRRDPAARGARADARRGRRRRHLVRHRYVSGSRDAEDLFAAQPEPEVA